MAWGGAAERYTARVAAVEAQLDRIFGSVPEDFWGRYAAYFKPRLDPRRELTPDLDLIASFINAEDVLIDVGGGGGRCSLPIALRCREVINIEPSPEACAVFRESAAKSGIANARCIQTRWPVSGVEGDITLVVNVTYYMRNIVPFIEALEAASGRRVMIVVNSWTALYQYADLFKVAHGEEMEQWPNFPELLPVLWEMGILPDVRVLPPRPDLTGTEWPETTGQAVELALAGLSPAHSLGRKVRAEDQEAVRARVEAHFEELFGRSGAERRPIRWEDQRDLLITWVTGQRPLGLGS